jgi:hypothetical protein
MRRFARAAAKGELRARGARRLRQYAWLLTNCSQGMGVVAKTCRDRKLLKGIVDSTFEALK